MGAATAAAPGVTTMGLGQSALVIGVEGISSSEISMSSPEDWWPCEESGKSKEGRPSGSQVPGASVRKVGVVVHACRLSAWEAEAGG